MSDYTDALEFLGVSEIGEIFEDEDLEAELLDAVVPATDGCSVEPDGKCPHGRPSVIRALGLM